MSKDSSLCVQWDHVSSFSPPTSFLFVCLFDSHVAQAGHKLVMYIAQGDLEVLIFLSLLPESATALDFMQY